MSGVQTEATNDRRRPTARTDPQGGVDPEQNAAVSTVVVPRPPRDPVDEPPPPEPDAGSRLGRYVILERLGHGGMGVVYAAYDSELDRRVALKLLRSRGRMPEGVSEGRARLLREAKAMAKLQHPNVVAVYDVGVLDGRVFVAMELVDGETLARWVRRHRRDIRSILEVFTQAGRGLAAAHAAGLVHRDFKPDNVLVGRTAGRAPQSADPDVGRVRVTDFGLARAADTLDAEIGSGKAQEPVSTVVVDELTQPGVVMGTPPYMAPEQCVDHHADPKIDQFAFCVALFEALYGRRPFRGRDRDELRDAMRAGRVRAVPKETNVPAWLHAAVMRGLAADPAERWPDMDALVRQLQPTPRRRRRLVLAGAAGACVATTGIAAMAWSPDPACAGGRRRLAGVWDEAAKATVRDALVSTDRPHASTTWLRVEEHLDAYAEAWVEMHTQACESATRDASSARLRDLQMACLDARREELDALVGVLSRGGSMVADGATHAAANLPLVTRCAADRDLAHEMVLPADPRALESVAAVRPRLSQMAVEIEVGASPPSLQALRDVVDEAHAVGHAPLRARALHLLGEAQADQGHLDEARETLSEAALMAAANDVQTAAAAAATGMMSVVGTEDYKQGLLWGWYAESAVERLGMGGPEEAAMLEGLGQVFSAHGEHAQAIEHLRRAAALRVEIHGDGHPNVADTLALLADAQRAAGLTKDALETSHAALRGFEAAYGDRHPALEPALRRLAELEDESGNDTLAKQYSDRAASLLGS